MTRNGRFQRGFLVLWCYSIFTTRPAIQIQSKRPALKALPERAHLICGFSCFGTQAQRTATVMPAVEAPVKQFEQLRLEHAAVLFRLEGDIVHG